MEIASHGKGMQYPASTLLLTVAALLGLVGCGGGGGSSASSPASSAASPSTTSGAASAPSTSLSAAAQLGEQLFGDTSLSVSGQLACITCHSPASAFGSIVSVQLGGPNMDIPGIRKPLSIMYASFAPPFSIAAGNTPTGGLMWDGRASSLALQAQEPFITSFEMANATPTDVIARLKASPTSLQEFEQVYGQAVLNNPAAALQDMGLAIAAYQTEANNVFQPFTSKFDYWLLGQAQLTAQEQHGLTLFNDPGSGNCAACHPSQVQSYSSHPLFTDFTYDNIGVPRNWAIPYSTVQPVSPVDSVSLSSAMPAPVNVPAGAEYNYYDLGLCGPFKPPSNDPNPRPDLSSTTSLCGFFKVPSLRNVAITAPYFHNGVFNTLMQVLQWSVTRNINNNAGNNPYPVPAGPNGNPYEAVGTFYTAADGTPDLYEYNDLPVTFDANVIIGEVPYTLPTFAGGQAPTLSEQDMDDIIAFLCTLTDGYNPSNPAAYSLPAQCLAAEAAN